MNQRLFCNLNNPWAKVKQVYFTTANLYKSDLCKLLYCGATATYWNMKKGILSIYICSIKYSLLTVLPSNIFKEYPHYSNRTTLHHLPCVLWNRSLPTTSFCPNKQTRKARSAISFEISLGVNKSDQVFQIHQEQGENDKICFHFSKL